jgi:hypothetical protein
LSCGLEEVGVVDVAAHDAGGFLEAAVVHVDVGAPIQAGLGAVALSKKLS